MKNNQDLENAFSTIPQIICQTKMCASWIRAVLVEGTQKQISVRFSNSLGFEPVNPIVLVPIDLAVSSALVTFFDSNSF